MLELTFLAADRPLVKSYSLDSKGVLVKDSYPNVKEFTSHVERVDGIAAFAAALSAHADIGHCLLKGSLARPLVAEPRAGSTDPNAPTSTICLDLDRPGRVDSLESAMLAVSFGDVSRVDQYSASYGVERDKGLTAHCFFILSEPVSPTALKQWLIHLNLTTPWLRSLISLTKTNNALSWPLDITTCQNDKLLYIAGPKLGPGVKSEFQGLRIQVVEKALPTLDVSRLVIPSAEQNRIAVHALLDELRHNAGLPKRGWALKTDKGSGLEVLVRPDASTLTGIREERGFVYFNLNGGDSWGYFHPTEAPEVIRNFKGEPGYLTSELLPEYWEQILQARKKARYAKNDKAVVVLAFRDFRTATYYNGTFEPSSNTLKLARAASETQLQHWLLEHGTPPLESIPVWELFYGPSDLGPRADIARKRINLFEATSFMSASRESSGAVQLSDPSLRGSTWTKADSLSRRCPSVSFLLNNAIGKNPALQEHALNWVACLLRHRIRLQAAGVWQGVEGTGKGIIVHKVLIPLLGYSNVAVKRMVDLEDSFNPYVETSILAVIDEAEVTESKRSSMIMASLKHQITEPVVSVRKMFTAAYTVPNYCSYLFLTNKTGAVEVSPTDRRFWIGEYSEQNFDPTQEFFDALEAELPSFAAYLHWRTADLRQARSIFESPERDLMKATSTNSLDATTQALLQGNIEFFWDSLPAGDGGLLSAETQALHDSYTKLVHQALRTKDGVQRVTRDELRSLIAYNVGDVARTPAKFTALLRHHRISLVVLRISERLVRGMEVHWKIDPAWAAVRLAELDKVPALRLAV